MAQIPLVALAPSFAVIDATQPENIPQTRCLYYKVLLASLQIYVECKDRLQPLHPQVPGRAFDDVSALRAKSAKHVSNGTAQEEAVNCPAFRCLSG